jgi:hypothetical protein
MWYVSHVSYLFRRVFLTWWTVAWRGIASLYDLDSITDDDELRLSTSSITTIPTSCVRSTAVSPSMCITDTSCGGWEVLVALEATCRDDV